MKKELVNKIKAMVVMFIVDFIATIVTINLLGYTFEFTKQSIGIIAMVNILTVVILSRFKLIEDGK